MGHSPDTDTTGGAQGSPESPSFRVEQPSRHFASNRLRQGLLRFTRHVSPTPPSFTLDGPRRAADNFSTCVETVRRLQVVEAQAVLCGVEVVTAARLSLVPLFIEASRSA